MAQTIGSLDLNAFSDLYSDSTQYFWFESNASATYGAGVHITLSPDTSFIANPSGQNILMNTDGISMRNGVLPMMVLDNDSLDFNIVDTTQGTYTNAASFGATTTIGIISNTQSHVQINSLGMNIYQGNDDVAFFGANARIGESITINTGQQNGVSSVSIGRLAISVGDYSIAEGTLVASFGASSHAEGGVFFVNYLDGFHSYSDVNSGSTVVDLSPYTTSGVFSSVTQLKVGQYLYYGLPSTSVGGIVEITNVDTSPYTAFKRVTFTPAIPESIDEQTPWYVLTTAIGKSSHAEGVGTIAKGDYSHAEGNITIASGNSSHAEGLETVASAYAHAEGVQTQATGNYSHSEGFCTIASGVASHAEGGYVVASGTYSHAEGTGADADSPQIASGFCSHAEGYLTQATGSASHAEGSYDTQATGSASHAEGWGTTSRGEATHSEGRGTDAFGNYSHAQNYGTVANTRSETTIGEYNIYQSMTANSRGTYAFILGNGTAWNARSNALTIDWNGGIQMYLDSDGTSSSAATSGTDMDLFNAIYDLGWYSDVIV